MWTSSLLLLSALVASSTAHSDEEALSEFHKYLKKRVGTDKLLIYEGAGYSAIQDPHTLDCAFERSQKCCWFNVGGKADELDWGRLNATIGEKHMDSEFGQKFSPAAPFLITGSAKTAWRDQALLVSCPLACQDNEGALTITYFLSKGVKLDVCRIELGSRQFIETDNGDNCLAKFSGSGTRTITIPPYDKPFHLALVASEFNYGDDDKPENGGGLAIVNDIVYQDATFCNDVDL